ncbi:MAG: hypothetical protein WA672_10835, partial [Candidatus Angelobacter sp.]
SQSRLSALKSSAWAIFSPATLISRGYSNRIFKSMASNPRCCKSRLGDHMLQSYIAKKAMPTVPP